jgi:hypothetical protein
LAFGATKDMARGEAIRRWPGRAGLFARGKDDGRAEAALIGIAGLRRDSAEFSAGEKRVAEFDALLAEGEAERAAKVGKLQ